MENNNQITIEFAPYRSSRAYGIGVSLNDLKEAILAGKEVAFDLDANTVTQLSTRLFCDRINLRVGLKVEGFSTVDRGANNHLFKLSKKQGAEQYKEYLKGVIAQLEELLEVKFKQEKFIVHTHVFA